VRAVLVLGALGYAGYVCVQAVAGSGMFRITRIAVRGHARLSTGEVLALVDDLKGQSILAADLAEWRSRVCESSWVRDATLRRSLPSTIEITIVERRPMAIGRLGSELFLIDGDGAIIDDYGPQYAELDLPVIDGLSSQATGSGPVLDSRRVELAARLLDALGPRPELARRISQVDVSDPRDAVVILDQDTVLVRLGEEQFAERLQSYVDLAPSLRERVADIDYVDLRFGERVYVAGMGQDGRRRAASQPAARPQPPA
ncbi:MAG: FtsQ-type POTRA domain-containing protein, partial [Acidobacteria bacterium]|nr:FtsQ-type POTRA domain-containing protein [Acidobacteriota bacterium]